jgi:chromosome segregation ATPase
MTSAILEIIGLLSVSCFIGFFFTYRFWKAKHDTLQLQIDILKNDVNEALQNVKTEQSKNVELQDELTIAQKQTEDANKEIEKLKTKKQERIVEHSKDDQNEIRALKTEIERSQEQMNEKEREIEVLSKELEIQKISYYKQIDGKRYKAATLKMADESVSGQGDGRISKEDAEQIFATISDGKSYTQVEKDTMHYLRENYNWTEGADGLFRTKVRSWAAKHHELN